MDCDGGVSESREALYGGFWVLGFWVVWFWIMDYGGKKVKEKMKR